MALMFIGRVGPITVLLSLMTKKKNISLMPQLTFQSAKLFY